MKYRVYDWESIAPYVDTLRVMTYDWSTGTPGPLAPLHWVDDTLAYAASVGVPPGKLQLGIPTYGKDWVRRRRAPARRTRSVSRDRCPSTRSTP